MAVMCVARLMMITNQAAQSIKKIELKGRSTTMLFMEKKSVQIPTLNLLEADLATAEE